ncbi:MAG: hypothetical protein ACK5KO_12690, partial [Arachnia sp.]
MPASSLPAQATGSDWLVEFYDEQGPRLHRLVVMLGGADQSDQLVRSALRGLAHRTHRLVDPSDRREYVEEQLVHAARRVRRGRRTISLPDVDDPRQKQVLAALGSLPQRSAEIIIVSHYLATFGPELAVLMRSTVVGTQARLEAALNQLRVALRAPSQVSEPGVLEALSQETTQALQSAARQIHPPAVETLEGDLRSFGEARIAGVARWVGAVAVVAAFSLGAWLAVATSSGPATATSPTASPAPSGSATPAAIAEQSLPGQAHQVPLYYLGRHDGKLYREYRDFPTSGDLVTS